MIFQHKNRKFTFHTLSLKKETRNTLTRKISSVKRYIAALFTIVRMWSNLDVY